MAAPQIEPLGGRTAYVRIWPKSEIWIRSQGLGPAVPAMFSGMGSRLTEYLDNIFRYGAFVRVTCPNCGTQHDIKAKDLMLRLPANTRVWSIGNRMRCTRCDHKGARTEPARLVTSHRF